MADEISKHNMPVESRNKYGNDFFDNAGDDFIAAIERGGISPDHRVAAQGEAEVDDNVQSSAGDSAPW